MTEQTINALCEKFHTTVDNLIPVYSKYAIAKDIASGLICLAIIIISIIIIFYIRHRLRAREQTDWWYDTSASEIILTIIAWAAIITCIIVFAINIYDYILWIVSPQMRFFDYMINMVE